MRTRHLEVFVAPSVPEKLVTGRIWTNSAADTLAFEVPACAPAVASMKPLTIITGVVLGSAASITLGLAVVILIFVITGLDQPRIRDEFPPLVSSVALFAILTAVSAASFVSLVRDRNWRWWAQAAMWALVGAIGVYYWPS